MVTHTELLISYSSCRSICILILQYMYFSLCRVTYKREDVTSPKTEGAESESEDEGEPEPKEQKVQEIDSVNIL